MSFINYPYGQVYNTGGGAVAVPVTNGVGGTTLLVAETSVGARRSFVITNPASNTGDLYLSFSSTIVPTSTLNDGVLKPGGTINNDVYPCYQGKIVGVLSVAGPENISVNRGT